MRARIKKHWGRFRSWASSKIRRKGRKPECVELFRLKTKRGNRCVCAAMMRDGRFSTIPRKANLCPSRSKVMTWKQAQAHYKNRKCCPCPK